MYWGTGIYEDQFDKTNNYNQYLFGVKDWNEDAFTTPAKPHVTYTMAGLKQHKAQFIST